MPKPMQALLVAASLLSGAALAGLSSRSASSQSLPPAPAQIGRYQLSLELNGDVQFITDTQTGRLWYRYGTGAKSAWEEQSPDYTKAPVTAKP